MKVTKLVLITFLIFFSSCLDSTDPYDDSEDLAFLEEYAQEEGVTETSSGLLYRVIEEGEGIQPSEDDIVVFNIRGEHVVTGEEIPNSFDEDYPRIISLETTLPGLQEAFQLMNTGATYELVMPSALSWGDGKVYQFKVELQNTQEQFMQNYSQREDVTTTESGLMYRVIEEGNGEEFPDENSTVIANYKRTFINGAELESNESVSFNLGGTQPPIDGLAEGFQLMSPGSTYEFLIPADLAYGDNPNPQSPIYPGAALIFEIDLIEIQ